MENYSLNKGYSIEVTPDMFEKAANDFSEGNEALKKLLTFCFEHDIKTNACCSGHNGQKRPYVQFEFSDKNMKSIIKMLKQLTLDDAIREIAFIKQPGVTSNLCVSMQDDKYNEGFEEILAALQYEKEIGISELDEKRQLILKTMQNHSISNSYLEIQEENDSIAIGAGNEYLSAFEPDQETIPWIEETQLAKYSKDSNEVNRTLHKLESRTKNIKYLTEHPYDSKKINDFWDNRHNGGILEINIEATMERQHEYGERNVAVADVLAGASIESFAKEVMQLHQYGQACITKFNSFVIDSRDYTNPDEIVQAYNKHRLERKSKNINKANNVTIEEVREATENVKISEINNETEKIKQEVKEEQQPSAEIDSQNMEPEL